MAKIWRGCRAVGTLMGMQNGTAILEDKECVVSWKTKHTLTIWSSSCTPWYFPKGAENMSTQRFAHRCLWFIVQSLSCAQLFVTPWTAAHQASLSFTISWSFLKLMSIELMMPSNHLILCPPPLLPSIFPSIRVFSTQVFIAVLFIIVKSQKQSGCSSVGEWINEQWYI